MPIQIVFRACASFVFATARLRRQLAEWARRSVAAAQRALQPLEMPPPRVQEGGGVRVEDHARAAAPCIPERRQRREHGRRHVMRMPLRR